jgi:DNA-binding XRE family transcriptional regulator
MARRVSAHRVKVHCQYTYESAAALLGVSVQTVRSWRKSGLQVLDSQKPHLILGFALKDFFSGRAKTPKRSLARDQFLCMTCNKAKRASGAIADYQPYNDIRGRLEVLCETCLGPCGKFASPALCAELAPVLTITTRNRK